MRIVRPGSVVGPQQQYLYLKQLEWAKWAAVDEMRKTQTSNAAALIPLVTPVTPPAETDDEVDAMQTTPTRSTVPLPPVTPSGHIAAATAKATSVVPPGQPRKTPNGKRAAQDSDDEEEADDVLPALGLAPVARKIKTVPSRGITASDQRPTRVTRSTAGAALIKKAGTTPAPPPSPVKPARQGPNKIPRLATTRTTSAAKALAAANAPPIQSRPVRNVNPPSSSNPSRLPMLIPSKRQHTSSLSDVAYLKQPPTATPDAWVANNVAAVVVPKSGRPGLRNVRRRRSSFSSADVIA
jgi:cell division cycle 14